MGKYSIHLDSFSGALADLKKDQRTEKNALAILAKSPMVSTWDMSENYWLCDLIKRLKRNGVIVEQDEPYPWHRFALTDAGKAMLAEPQRIGHDEAPSNGEASGGAGSK